MAKRAKKSGGGRGAKKVSRTRGRTTARRAMPARQARPAGRRKAAAKPARPHGDHDIEFIARGLWLHGSRALLCRNLDKDYLYLPGGHVEFGESAGEALEREFLEEAGVRVASGRLVLVTEGVFETRKRWHHEINLVFHVELGGSGTSGGVELSEPPTVRSREKGIGFEWVDLAAAVDLDIRPLAVKAWLAAGAGVDPAAARAEWVSEIPR